MQARPADDTLLARRMALVQQHVQAERDHDVAAIMATFGTAPTFVLNDATLTTRADIQGLYESFGFGSNGAFSDLSFETVHRHVAGDAIVLEGMLAGKHTGPWQGIEPTQRAVRLPLCAVFTFDRDEKLAGERVYCDITVVLKQLGVLS